MRIASGVTDQYIYFVAVDATDLKSRETGLTGFTVYRSRNGGAAAAYTTPTINETDGTNMQGVYELLLDEDMTIDSGDDTQEICLHITHTEMAPVTRVIELYRPETTLGNTLDVNAGGEAGLDLDNTSGTLDAAQIGADAITAAKVASDVSAEIADAVLQESVDDHKATANSLAEHLDAVQLDVAELNDTKIPDTVSLANINAQVDTALADIDLDHLTNNGTAVPAVAAGTFFDQVMDDGTATFDRTTDSLQAIRDRGDAAWTTGAGSGLSPLASGTAQSGTASTIQLASGETFADDELNGNIVKITSGTGAGQARLITDYTGATDTANVVPNWTTNPDATSVYEVVEGSMNVAAMDTGVVDADAIATDAVGAAELATDAVNEIRDAILADSTAFNGADIAAILTDTADMQPKLGTPAGADISADIAAVKTEADKIALADAGTGVAGSVIEEVENRAIPGDAMDLVAGAVDATSVATGAIDADAIATDAIGAAELATDAVNEIRDAILADSTAFNGADIAAILTDTADMQPKLGTPAGADMSADIAAVQADLPARITKNTAFANFRFRMRLSSDNVTAATGLTFGAGESQVAIDAGSFGDTANSPVEIGNGVYRINLDAADLNGDAITLRFSNATADDTIIDIYPQPT